MTRRLQRQSPSEDEPRLQAIWGVGASIALSFDSGIHWIHVSCAAQSSARQIATALFATFDFLSPETPKGRSRFPEAALLYA